jgi:hypothetical protein
MSVHSLVVCGFMIASATWLSFFFWPTGMHCFGVKGAAVSSKFSGLMPTQQQSRFTTAAVNRVQLVFWVRNNTLKRCEHSNAKLHTKEGRAFQCETAH